MSTEREKTNSLDLREIRAVCNDLLPEKGAPGNSTRSFWHLEQFRSTPVYPFCVF